jgi:hypothetical protein
MATRHLGEMFQQSRSHAVRMILVGNGYRDLRGFWVVAGDDVIRHSD